MSENVKLVPMRKEEKTGEYHPDNVQEMLNDGWQVVEEHPADAKPSPKKADTKKVEPKV